jgi:threonine dehydrogenase-like Zn-dependent dehydrogenase
VLSCVTRGIDPACEMCQAGRTNLCEQIAFGHLEPGLQCGYCESTGGGWSTAMVAHRSQLVAVPDDLSDEAAVLVEPTACAVHAARQVADGQVAVIGSGTLGLLTIAALRSSGRAAHLLIATAKHPEQRRWAKELGADVVCAPDELARHIRSETRSMRLGDRLTGGIDTVVDCVGSADSLTQALSVVAPGGTVHVVGMPGVTKLDLTSLWHREVALRGAYAYTTGIAGEPDDFATAVELVRLLDLGRLVSATYPMARYEDAVAHAATAGTRGAVKIAFDLRDERERNYL